MKTTYTLLLALAIMLGSLTSTAQKMPVTTSSELARAHFVLGTYLAFNAEIAKANMQFEAALDADPSFAMAAAWRAALSPDVTSKDVAGYRAIATNYKSLSAGERAAIDVYLMDDQKKIIENLKSLMKQYPDDATLPFLLGFNENGLGNSKEAQKAFQASLALDANHPGALNGLGYAYLAEKDYANAEKAFKRYIASNSGSANPYDSYGEMLMMQGRYDEAAKQFKLAVEKNPDFTASANNLVRIEIEKQVAKFEEAFNKRKAADVANFYTRNAMVCPPSSAPIEGREAIQKALEAMFANAKPTDKLDITTTGVIVVDERTVVERGNTIETSDGKPMKGEYVALWGFDGESWKMFQDMWTEYEAPAMAASEKR